LQKIKQILITIKKTKI